MTNQQLDRISGVIFTSIGILTFVGAWLMPRFTQQGASLYEAPGLTPGFLGIGMSICGLLLATRRVGKNAEMTNFWDHILGSSINRRRAILAILLTCGYAGVLFGNIPFIPATILFVFAFIVVFEWPSRKAAGVVSRHAIRTIMAALVIAVVIGFATKFLFQDLFLIQLP